MHPLDDAEVMRQVRDGRVEMLAVLFERYHVKLFNFFLRLTGDRSASEDLVQELFLRLLKYRGTFRDHAPFRAWAYGIARHVHLTYLHRRRPDAPLDDLLDTQPAATETPERQVERREDEDLLKKALERLPLHKRELLLLSRQHDVKYKDLACMCECSLGAMKTQVHRAMKDLRRVFLELQGGTQ